MLSIIRARWSENDEAMDALSEEQGETGPVVGISLCGSAPLVWRIQDVRALREGGLVGALLGALPRTPRQNGRMGRPLLLLEEEERALREGHHAGTPPPPGWEEGAELRLQYDKQQRRSQSVQSTLALEDKKAGLLQAMSSSQEGSDRLQQRLQDLECSFTFPLSALAVQISTARAGLSHCPEARSFLHPDPPITEQQDDTRRHARYQVFKDLRGQGFFLTSAGKFGGDFLVYPGDPLRFHAHFIAVCVAVDEPQSLLDLLSLARLGSNVKKTVLLCSPGTEGRVLYTSLQWSGMV
ncbi:tRNA-splicing endonuclease subunit Sen34 [Gouania willdenowi]|nr:tRNA-splicing endonuclease subunit Sen34 [Gouania willdenowi]